MNYKKKREIYLVLHNIRSAHNVGSIFRTADAAGVSEILISGYTPAPTDRFGRERKDIAKIALGAESSVSWKYYKTARQAIESLKKSGVYIVGAELSKNSVDYRKLKYKYSVAFVFGNEVRGLSKQILSYCDKISQIPMHGKKESLNVSVAAGVFLFCTNSINK